MNSPRWSLWNRGLPSKGRIVELGLLNWRIVELRLLNCRTVELLNWDLESSVRDKKLRSGKTKHTCPLRWSLRNRGLPSNCRIVELRLLNCRTVELRFRIQRSRQKNHEVVELWIASGGACGTGGCRRKVELSNWDCWIDELSNWDCWIVELSNCWIEI